MGRVKDYLMDCLYELSAKTGYTVEFLLDMWLDCMISGNDWDFFEGVTLERDW